MNMNQVDGRWYGCTYPVIKVVYCCMNDEVASTRAGVDEEYGN